MLPVSFYGGYFGAGVGVLLLGVLSVATGGDYRSANVVKNLVASLNTFVAATYFVAKGAVDWPPTLMMMAGCVFGGFFGSHLARMVPSEDSAKGQAWWRQRTAAFSTAGSAG